MYPRPISAEPHKDAVSVAVAGECAEDAKERPGVIVDSSELLQGARVIAIRHNGALYRLQSTKLGKLILTK